MSATAGLLVGLLLGVFFHALYQERLEEVRKQRKNLIKEAMEEVE